MRHSELAKYTACYADFESAADNNKILQSEGEIYEELNCKNVKILWGTCILDSRPLEPVLGMKFHIESEIGIQFVIVELQLRK